MVATIRDPQEAQDVSFRSQGCFAMVSQAGSLIRLLSDFEAVAPAGELNEVANYPPVYKPGKARSFQ